MADIANETQTEDGSTESVTPSSDGALTPEERDAQTIARAFGLQSDEKPDEAQPPAGDEAAGETETEGDGEGEPTDEGTAATEGEGDADDEPEVTDEDIEAILDGLEERLINNPRLRARIEAQAKADADRRFEEQRRAQSASQESERLIGQGRQAVESLFTTVNNLAEQLTKAGKGESFEAVALDEDAIKSHLRDYGTAVNLVARREFDEAFSEAFRLAVPVGGNLTEDEAETVKTLVATAQRIENDPNQGSAKAKNHLFVEGIKFLTERAKAAGAAEARAEIEKRRSALKKIVGDKGENATTAAMAKIARTRSKTPPKGPRAEPTATGVANMDAYRAAKAAGEHDKADEILAQMALDRAAGRGG